MSKEDFDLYWKTHLVTSSQGCNLPEVSVLYWNTAKEETNNFPWTRREGTSRSHATAAAARDLLTQVRVATRKYVLTATLIQNYSPCSDCAQEILKTLDLAKEKRIKFDISIAFVALNRIRRPSWIWRGMEDAFHGVTINESNANCLGLQQLQVAGVKMSTFNSDTWRFLYTFLGNGLPVESHGKFLGGKFSSVESRLEEDKFMEADFRQILRGVTLITASSISSNNTLDIGWTHPSLAGDKVSEYRIICKKVTVRNGDDDDILWRIQKTMDKLGVIVTVSKELSSCQVNGLDYDAFYDVTVEAIAKGMSICIGRKLYRTSNKVPILSLQTPPAVNKSSTSARPRTSSTTAFTNIATPGSSTRLQRSNSVQSATTRGFTTSSELDHKTVLNAGASVLKRTTSNAGSTRIEEGANRTKSSTIAQGLSRSYSISSETGGRKMSEIGETRGKATTEILSGKTSSTNGRKIINSSNSSTTAL